ncbi:DUF6172 family protein [Marinicellulosiphila megalodicopiae]|uniref:DUF6172 family protein n=1 Tax=Marinicellulosiphila megalodicopiae TaxID=2724896 RepID=UPI003BB0296B
MKKTYNLDHPKIKPARLVESAKHDVKKYLKRERNKALPSGFDYWEFDCKFGLTQESAAVVLVENMIESISQAESEGCTGFYIEILARSALKSERVRFSS